MKKFLACLLILALGLSLTACMGNGNLKGEATENGGTDSQEGGLENGKNEQEQSLASRLVDDFKLMLDEDNMMGARALADRLLKGDTIDFQTSSVEVKPGKLKGFKGEITGFKEGYLLSSADAKSPFLAYVFNLEEKTEVEQFVRMLKDQADAEWNSAQKADEVMVEGLGKMVLFVMHTK